MTMRLRKINKLNNLLDEILTDIGCDCNLKPQLIEALDSETCDYYELLNSRAQNNKKIAKVELDILRQKIYDRISECKLLIYIKFIGDSQAHPAASAYTFDKDDINRKTNRYHSMPNLEYIVTQSS